MTKVEEINKFKEQLLKRLWRSYHMEKDERISVEGCDGKDTVADVEDTLVVLKQALSIALAIPKLTV